MTISRFLLKEEADQLIGQDEEILASGICQYFVTEDFKNPKVQELKSRKWSICQPTMVILFLKNEDPYLRRIAFVQILNKSANRKLEFGILFNDLKITLAYSNLMFLENTGHGNICVNFFDTGERGMFRNSVCGWIESYPSFTWKLERAAVENTPLFVKPPRYQIGSDVEWWNNEVAEKAKVKFIGFLKGHRALFAGLHFENPIGAGTGVFEKEQLFKCPDGYAAFVEYQSIN